MDLRADPATSGLLDDILEHPDDDGPRLVLADWLEEHDQPLRALYLRTRVAFDRLPDCGHDWVLRPGGLACPACRRKDELYEATTTGEGFPVWEKCFWSWWPPFLRHWEEAAFRRGFVQAVTCRWEEFRDHAQALLRAQPVQAVTLTTWPTLAAESVWASPTLRRVSEGTVGPAPTCRYRVAGMGGRWRYGRWPGLNTPGQYRLALGDLWPGITFTLPGPLGEPQAAPLDYYEGD